MGRAGVAALAFNSGQAPDKTHAAKTCRQNAICTSDGKKAMLPGKAEILRCQGARRIEFAVKPAHLLCKRKTRRFMYKELPVASVSR